MPAPDFAPGLSDGFRVRAADLRGGSVAKLAVRVGPLESENKTRAVPNTSGNRNCGPFQRLGVSKMTTRRPLDLLSAQSIDAPRRPAIRCQIIGHIDHSPSLNPFGRLGV